MAGEALRQWWRQGRRRAPERGKPLWGAGWAWQACEVIVEVAPRFLAWDEVDPTRQAFDGASVAQTVRSLGPAGCVPVRPDVPSGDPAMSTWSRDEAQSWADAMSYALVQQHGRWTIGWRWAHDEGISTADR